MECKTVRNLRGELHAERMANNGNLSLLKKAEDREARLRVVIDGLKRERDRKRKVFLDVYNNYLKKCDEQPIPKEPKKDCSTCDCGVSGGKGGCSYFLVKSCSGPQWRRWHSDPKPVVELQIRARAAREGAEKEKGK